MMSLSLKENPLYFVLTRMFSDRLGGEPRQKRQGHGRDLPPLIISGNSLVHSLDLRSLQNGRRTACFCVCHWMFLI